MRTLPLTVLAYDGPIARAYLCGLRRAGLRPTNIVLLAIDGRGGNARRVWKWLPGGFRTTVARKSQDLSHNYWPREIRRRHPALVAAIAKAVAGWRADAMAVYDEMYGTFSFEDYADHLECTLADGYGDTRIAAVLERSAARTVLFTGGGIVPRRLLALDGMRFLHVHPGYLPFVRGADGLLWSTLVRGKPGASAFFLNDRIDTGDVVAASELAPFSIALEPGSRPDDRTLYRALFAFVDPLLRTSALVPVLEACAPDSLEGHPQDRAAGRTYHFMAEEMRAVSLRKIFVDGH